MRNLIARFVRDDSGATAIEYGLIVSLIFVAILGAVQTFGGSADSLLSQAMAKIAEALA